MAPDERIAHAARGRRYLIRPLFYAAIGLTLFGNLSQAQLSVGGWISHGWAPIAYLVLVEILVFDILAGGWAVPVRVGLVILAAVAFVISYHSLMNAALTWGWDPGMAWLFPLIVDLVAVLMTFAQLSVAEHMRRLRSGDEPEAEPATEPQPEPERLPEPAPERRSDPNSIAERIIAAFGTDPNMWPGPTELAEQLGCSKSTASTNRTKAAAIVARSAPEPVSG